MLLDAFPISEATTFPSRYLTVCVCGAGRACVHVSMWLNVESRSWCQLPSLVDFYFIVRISV